MTFKVICRKEIIYKNSTSPLCLLFFQGKRKKAVGLGVSVALKHWDAEAQKVTDDCPDRDNIQFQITAKVKEYEKKIQRLEIMDIPVTFENLFEQNSKRLNCSVGEYLKQTIERLETLGKYGSASKHRSLLSRLSEFRSLNTRFDEIDLAFLRDFELFLRKEGNVNNSIATKFAIFKAAYNKALAESLFLQKINPFAKYKVGSLWTRTRKRAITKEDIQKLVALEIAPNYRTSYAAFARDIFLFSYYTAGINFTDMATLRYCDIVDGRIYYSRHKTQKLLSFQLVPNAMRIIEKYSKANHAQEDYIFPILDRSGHKTAQQIFNRTHKILRKVNRVLKTLGERPHMICWKNTSDNEEALGLIKPISNGYELTAGCFINSAVRKTDAGIYKEICDFCKVKGVAGPIWDKRAMSILLTKYNAIDVPSNEPISIIYQLDKRCKTLPEKVSLPYL